MKQHAGLPPGRLLAGLAEELRARTATPDRGGGDDGAGRSVRLDLNYRGAGRLRGDLTPRCAEALRAVLDALGKKAGPEDTRTRAQRDHDALQDALRRLIAAGCVPDRAGQPTKIQLHMTLDQLLDLQPGVAAGQPGPEPGQPGSREAARRALFPERGDLTEPRPAGWAGPGPPATPGDLCDASIVPIVTGHVDHELLDRLAATLLGHASTPAPAARATRAAPRPPGSPSATPANSSSATPSPCCADPPDWPPGSAPPGCTAHLRHVGSAPVFIITISIRCQALYPAQHSR